MFDVPDSVEPDWLIQLHTTTTTLTGMLDGGCECFPGATSRTDRTSSSSGPFEQVIQSTEWPAAPAGARSARVVFSTRELPGAQSLRQKVLTPAARVLTPVLE